jgi:hypothetical protein
MALLSRYARPVDSMRPVKGSVVGYVWGASMQRLVKSGIVATIAAVAVAVGVSGCKSSTSGTGAKATAATAAGAAAPSSVAAPAVVSTNTPGRSATSPAVTPDATTPPSPTAGTASNPSPAHAQGKLAGVPAQCPSPDDITLAVHLSIPHVYQTEVSGALDCTYYADGSADSPAVNILIAALPGGTTVASWEAGTKNANSSAVFVPGVGDAAFYFTTGAPSGLNFISGGVACNMYTGNFTADQAHLVALAESILEG